MHKETANDGIPYTWVTQKEICEIYGRSQPSISRTLSRLSEKIKRIPNGHEIYYSLEDVRTHMPAKTNWKKKKPDVLVAEDGTELVLDRFGSAEHRGATVVLTATGDVLRLADGRVYIETYEWKKK